MTFRFASLSQAGPRPINEDAVGVWVSDANHIFAAVADGLGGMGGGSEASQLALRIFKDSISSNLSEDALYRVANDIHIELRKRQTEKSEHANMATTFTAISADANSLYGVHCGDTRAMISRGKGIKRLTEDHSEGVRLFRAGKLTKNELIDYPRKHILDSALGIHGEPKIETFKFAIQPKDKLFLTSDGVHQKIKLRELQHLSVQYEEPEELLIAIDIAIKEREADDNYSMVLVYCY